MKRKEELRTWVEINKSAIAKNFKTIKERVSRGTLFMAVVKSNAYGHDMTPFAKEMAMLGADWLGVDDIDEALVLRKAGIRKPILVFGQTLPARFPEATEENISITISNFDSLKAIATIYRNKEDLDNDRGSVSKKHLFKQVLKQVFPKKLKIHIKVDTGLNRQGFLASDLPKILETLHATRYTLHAEVQGLYTHFSAAESYINGGGSYTHKQLEEFEKWKTAFNKSGLNPICHTAATAATLVCPESHFDMVRVGLGLYGLWPSAETRKAAEKTTRKLHPVLSWKAVVGDVKKIPTGALVGYDCTEAVKKDSTIAVIPVGYWHGFSRSLSSVGAILIGGKRAKVLGRVSMDMFVVDVTGIKNFKTGDEAVIIGKQGREEITAEEVAMRSETINYEIVTRIQEGIKRIYI